MKSVKKNSIELLKTVGIGVLCLCAAALLIVTLVLRSGATFREFLTYPLQTVRSSFQLSAGEVISNGGQTTYNLPEVKPFTIVFSSEGNRLCEAYDDERISYAMQNLYPLILEAAGSSSPTEKVSRQNYLAALSKSGVYISYDSYLPSELVLYGRESHALSPVPALAFRALLLTEEDGKICLYYDSKDGYFSGLSVLASDALSDILKTSSGSKCSFAFEIENYSKIFAPDTVIYNTTSSIYNAKISTAFENAAPESLSALPVLFGFNLYSLGSYLERDGTNVYVDTPGILRMRPGGQLLFEAEGEGGIRVSSLTPGISSHPGEGELFAAAYSLASTIGAEFLNSGEFYPLESIQNGEEFTFVFGVRINGVPVLHSGNIANSAAVIIRDGVVTSAYFQLRSYTLSPSQSEIPSQKVTAAMLSGQTEARISLRYLEDETGELLPYWASDRGNTR